MKGTARAPGAATVVNAIATMKGAAFAVDLWTQAEVEVDDGFDGVEGEIAEGGDSRLIERCVERVLERADVDAGARVRTESEVPQASGLKSSSAAANAAVLAAADAVDLILEAEEAALEGVEAARDVGVTVTGAFDDAAASMLGGVVLTDNSSDDLLARESFSRDVAVYVPPEKARSADTDVERSRLVAPAVEHAFDLASEGEYADAMTINGFAYCAALDRSAAPAVDALEHAEGAGLSGTGPSFAAVADTEPIDRVVDTWDNLEGTTLKTRTVNQGASATSDGR